MVWFGWGGKEENLGLVESRHCDVCEKERPFSLILQYRYLHFCWLFNMITEERYHIACDICRRGVEIPKNKIKEMLVRDPISPFKRFGCLTFVIISIILIISGQIK